MALPALPIMSATFFVAGAGDAAQDIAAFLHVEIFDRPSQIFEPRPVGRGKARLEQQILRWVAGQGQLRKENNIGLVFAGAGQVMLHLGRITLDVADR